MQFRFHHILIISTFTLVTSCALFRLKPFANSLAKTKIETNDYVSTVKFTLKTWMYVKAKIEGQSSERELMFDTGSPVTYTYKTKKELGLRTKKILPHTEGGKGGIEFGGIKMVDLAYLVSDEAAFYNPTGIFGVNAMQHSIWEINFADSSIKFSNNLKNFTNIAGSYSTKFKPFGAQETPVLKFAIGKDTIDAFIDTGFPGFIELSGDFKPDTHSVSIRTSSRNVTALGYKSKKDYFVDTKYLKTRSLNIAGYDLGSVILTQTKQYRGRSLIGLQFLQAFIVTINWPDRVIYFKPNDTRTFPRSISSYGFHPANIDGTLKVSEVFKNAEGEKLGLKPGDVIVSINGQPVSNIDKSVLRDLYSNTPTTKEIKLLVSGKPEMILRKTDLFQ